MIEMTWNGRRYRRHPEASQRAHRVYWQATTAPRTYLHRDVYEANHGPIPDGWHVHHIDGDPLNNHPSNLEALPADEHAAHHVEEREPRTYVCDECGQRYESTANRDNLRWCGPPCKERWRRREGVAYKRPKKGPYLDDRQCEQCGADYVAKRPWARFCSGSCRQAFRKLSVGSAS